MGVRDYKRLGIIAFGEHLLKTGDLDPIYVALSRMDLTTTARNRWLLAYWTFYHAGVASYMADSADADEFWLRMETAGANLAAAPTPFGERWPRGHERRHMRGHNALKCIGGLKDRYRDTPENFVPVCQAPTCKEVMAVVEEHMGFGPWIGFKVADMLERVCGIPVSFERAEVFIFKDPKKAALLFWRRSQGMPEGAKPRDEQAILEMVVQHLIKEFAEIRGHKAPPAHDRPVGIQEVETVLCKWKSHLNGHYPLNNDIVEIGDGLKPWLQHSNIAQQFAEAMPK